MALVILVTQSSAAAEQSGGKIPRIGILMNGSPASHRHFVDWFFQGLGYHGYMEGRNVKAITRWSMGKPTQLRSLARELIEEKVEVILINGSSSIRAVLAETRTVPVVVGSARDLDKYVDSQARPGGNITGLTYNSTVLGTKRLALLKEALPRVRRVAYMYSRRDKRTLRDLRLTETIGNSLNISVLPMQVQSLADLESAFELMAKENADALVINNYGFTILHRKRLAAQAIAKGIPTICEQVRFAHAGCLMSYARDLQHMMYRAAYLVNKILTGARPAQLPVETPTKYKLVINLKTAGSLGIKLPPAILLQANEVIE